MADPLQCAPGQKAALEARNGVEQLDYLSGLVNDHKIAEIRESHVLALHELAIRGIYPCGGQYRDARSHVHISQSLHKVPSAALVPGHLRDLLDYINRKDIPAIRRAAYALWRFNWIHPFRGGNGRSARALTYLVLCIDFGSMPPGEPTFPTVIYDRRREYVLGLQAADASHRALGEADEPSSVDTSAMEELVEDAITQQLANALASLRTNGDS